MKRDIHHELWGFAVGGVVGEETAELGVGVQDVRNSFGWVESSYLNDVLLCICMLVVLIANSFVRLTPRPFKFGPVGL